MADFDESKVKRDKDGKFAEKNAGNGQSAKELDLKYNQTAEIAPKKKLKSEKSTQKNADNVRELPKGAKSGALDSDNKDYDRALKHAELMYETYRNSKGDVPKIAKLTGYTEQEINEIKEYVFNNPEFAPDYDQAQTWDRLRKGQPIEADIIFLKHELMELGYRKQGYSYDEAHEMTEKVYNYKKAIMEYKNGIFGKNRSQ